MLRNFITTSDLAKYDIAIERYLPQSSEGGEIDWSTQIAEAFELIKDKLREKNVSSRLMGLPLDLNRSADSNADENGLIQLTKAGSFTGTHIVGHEGFRRFAINVLILQGDATHSFTLHGSNDCNVTDSTEPETWTTIQTIQPAEAGEAAVLFQDEYKYYRVDLTTEGEAGSIAFTAALYETYQDRWIIWLTLSLIYKMISKGADDVWLKKSQDAYAMFESAFDNYPFEYDSDDDNMPDQISMNSATLRLLR